MLEKCSVSCSLKVSNMLLIVCRSTVKTHPTIRRAKCPRLGAVKQLLKFISSIPNGCVKLRLDMGVTPFGLMCWSNAVFLYSFLVQFFFVTPKWQNHRLEEPVSKSRSGGKWWHAGFGQQEIPPTPLYEGGAVTAVPPLVKGGQGGFCLTSERQSCHD
jgi:hypothetical protein